MKIYQIIQGIDNPSAGTTYSVGYLSHNLALLKHDVTVMALGGRPPYWPYNSTLQVFDGFAVRIGLAPWAAIRSVRHSIQDSASVLHGHGVWRVANLFPLAVNTNTAGKLVWSPRGMFAQWSLRYKAARKAAFWALLQRPALRRVDGFHATSRSEVEDIRKLGFRQPIALIPNAVDMPALPSSCRRTKTIVFLGRLHEVKGLHLLVPVWAQLADHFPDWELIIAGKIDSSYARSIVKLAQDLDTKRLKFVGEVLDEAKSSLLSTCRLFVLPSFSENFGIVIAEALAHAVPVITTVGTPWTTLAQRGCGWTIVPNGAELKQALRTALGQSESGLEGMGMIGRKWIEEEFAWKRVAGMFEAYYKWLHEGGQKPSCVY